MPWEALDKDTDEIIHIYQFYPHPKARLDGRTLLCPVCEEEVAVRRESERAQAHFYHTLRGAQHDWPYNESRPHRAVKAALQAWLKQDVFWRAAKAVHQEAVIETNRRSDLMVLFPDGTRAAHEIQLQSLPTADFERRAQAYRQAGVPVFWWFRRRYLQATKPNLRRAIVRRQPYHLLVTLTMPPNPHAKERGHHRLRNRWPRKIEFGAARLTYWEGWEQNYLSLNTERSLTPESYRILWRPLLHSVLRRTLAKAPDWPDNEDIHARLHPVWQERLTPEAIDEMLVELWEAGEMVAGPEEGWKLQYLPDFNPWRWKAWLENNPAPKDADDEYLARSIAWHTHWWTKRLKGCRSLPALKREGNLIADFEQLTTVKKALKAVYKQQLARLAAVGNSTRKL